MKVVDFVKIINKKFFTGVPDSQLRALCDYLMDTYGIDSKHHVIAANEGNCTALACGYHLATGKVPVVYMQNSGQGNVVNPVCSLLNEKVYNVPVMFIVGWRGEPGVHDEPQHVFQGEITLKLLEDLGIEYFVIDKETTVDELKKVMKKFNALLKTGKNVSFVIKKGALEYENKVEYKNSNVMKREDIIKHIVNVSDTDPIVSTTGKASRELFEYREEKKQGHKYDFLTVGSMGHSSSIALGVALNKPKTKVWCIDGDGALLMHMGSLAVIGNIHPKNLVHVLINNGAHETVGGMPTVASNINFLKIAKSCGYKKVFSASTFEELDDVLVKAKESKVLTFIEVKSSIGARSDLGRPTTTAVENKESFMEYLSNLK